MVGSENYPHQMAKELARLMSETKNELVLNLEDVTSDDFDKIEYSELYTELLNRFEIGVVKWVAKVHDQLGHPSSAALAAALQEMKADELFVQCARLFLCEACLRRQRPKRMRVASLPRASYFNEVVDADTFFLIWKGKKKKIFSIMCENSRYEVDAVIKRELAKNEIKIFEKQWLSWAGAMHTLRVDSSGAHMGDEFAEWCRSRGIRLVLIPRDAHHELGMLERNHQVRREQIAIYHDMHPEDSLKVAVRVTQQQRNRLRNVRGFTPVQRALGTLPTVPGTLSDEPTKMTDISASGEDFHADIQRRADAGKAFLQANISRAVRAALAARNRPLRRRFQVGEWVYYWRRGNLESGLLKCYWKGPAIVSHVEYKGDDLKIMEANIWCVHGSALIRSLHEMVRPEMPQERTTREAKDDEHGIPLTPVDEWITRMKKTRGPVRFVDLTEHSRRRERTRETRSSMPTTICRKHPTHMATEIFRKRNTQELAKDQQKQEQKQKDPQKGNDKQTATWPRRPTPRVRRKRWRIPCRSAPTIRPCTRRRFEASTVQECSTVCHH